MEGDETFDEFSEIFVTHGGGGNILPPSSSRSVAEATRFAAEVLTEVDNLEGADGETEDHDVFDETEVVDEDTQQVEETFEGVSATEHAEDASSDPEKDDNLQRHVIFVGERDGDDDDDMTLDNEELQEDGEVGIRSLAVGDEETNDALQITDSVAEDEKEDDVLDGSVVGSSGVVDVPSVGDEKKSTLPATSSPFALSRVKALFRYFNELSSGEMAQSSTGASPPVLCSLSTDAAELLAEATALMIRDLVNSVTAETKRHNKKTVSYDDVAFVASQLDRYAFMSEFLLPVPLPSAIPKKSTTSVPPASRAAPTQVHQHPAAPAATKAKSNRRMNAQPQPDPRQRTLDFSKIARPS